MLLKLLTSDAQRIYHNALIYADRKSDSRGDTLWSWYAEDEDHAWLEVTTSDDFAILVDRVPADLISGGEPYEFTMNYGYLKEREKLLRIETSLEVMEQPEMHAVAGHILGDYREVVEWPDFSGEVPEKFAFWPDRLRKLNLIKPGKQPVEFRWSSEGTLQFKVGTDTYGALAPLDMTKLES